MKTTPKFLKDDSIIYFALNIFLIVILIIERLYVYAAISGLILIIVAVFTLRRQIQREKELKNYIINYTKNIESLSVNSFYYSPMPISIMDINGKIYWFNNKFRELVGDEAENIENIEEFIPDFSLKGFSDNKEGTLNNIEITDSGKTFNIMYYRLEEGRFGNDSSYVCYWNENTAFANLKTKYNDERPVSMLVQIDNYDEISEKLDKGEKSAMTAEVEKILDRYASEMNGFVLRYDTAKFLMMIENKFLEILEAKKFSMLEDVRALKGSSGFSFTLSI